MPLAFIGGVGPLELTIVLVIALLVLGPKRLPQAARGLGAGMREFRDSLSGDRSDPPAALEEETRAGA
jgi:sec-independent protein translocase protein TatA